MVSSSVSVWGAVGRTAVEGQSSFERPGKKKKNPKKREKETDRSRALWKWKTSMFLSPSEWTGHSVR